MSPRGSIVICAEGKGVTKRASDREEEHEIARDRGWNDDACQSFADLNFDKV